MRKSRALALLMSVGGTAPGASTAGTMGPDAPAQTLAIKTSHFSETQLFASTFEKTTLKIAITECKSGADSFDAGLQLANKLDHEGLNHVFIVSNGLHDD